VSLGNVVGVSSYVLQRRRWVKRDLPIPLEPTTAIRTATSSKSIRPSNADTDSL